MVVRIGFRDLKVNLAKPYPPAELIAVTTNVLTIVMMTLFIY